LDTPQRRQDTQGFLLTAFWVLLVPVVRVSRSCPGFIPTGSDLPQDGNPAARWILPRPPLPLETSMPGVFAAGDVRHGSVKRVASAVGEGSIAATQLYQYLDKQAQGS
jgi:thioredoxin reductase (NADPH)